MGISAKVRNHSAFKLTLLNAWLGPCNTNVLIKSHLRPIMGNPSNSSRQFATIKIVKFMKSEFCDTGRIRPEMAQKILAKNGVEVSLDEAKNVLKLLTYLVNLSMDQLLDQE